MTRIVLAGTGLIGIRHMAHIVENPDLTLAAVIDPTPAADIPAPVYPSLDALDIAADGILIATPTSSHAPLAIAAAKRGLHALVEKPLADTLANADAMIAAHKAAGTHLLVGHHRRHHPAVARLQEIIASGAIGTPVNASLMWLMRKPDDYFDPEWRQGIDGAPIKQNLIHDVDMLRWLLGEVNGVAGLASNAQRGAARPESGGAVLRFDTGATATIAYADTSPTPWGFEAATGESPHIPHTAQDYLHIAGTKGGLSFPSLTLWTGAAHWNEAHQKTQHPAPTGVPLARQIKHFADVIEGRAAPLVTGEDGRANLDVILQIEQAASVS